MPHVVFAAAIIQLLVIAGTCGVVALLTWQIYRVWIRRSWVKRVALPDLTAYAQQGSVDVEESFEICVHSTQGGNARLFRLGQQCVETGWSTAFERSPQSNRYDFWRGFTWPTTMRIDTSELSSGLYLLELEHAGDSSARFRVPLIVKPRAHAGIAVIASTNTWEAYNSFGGLGNYDDFVTPAPLSWLKRLLTLVNWRIQVGNRHRVPCVPLPFARPNIAADEDLAELHDCPTQNPSHLVRGEWSVLRFLESEGLQYSLYSDKDVAYDHRPFEAKLLIFQVHSEYWSEEMIAQLRGFLERGGRAIFLSGNNMYRKVQFLEHGLIVYDFRAPDKLVSELLGAAYDARGYLTWAGYQVAAADHWALAGLNVANGDVFADESSSQSSEPRPYGASGYETDKVTGDSRDVTILAIGQNPEGPAQMTFRDTDQGGWVMNTSSVASGPWLNHDPVLAGIVRNLAREALSGERPSSNAERRAA